MQYLTLNQFRSTLDAGGVLSVSLVGQGGFFVVQAETRKGEAMLIKSRGVEPRQYRDLNKAMGLLREMGIREARIDVRQWRPEQGEML